MSADAIARSITSRRYRWRDEADLQAQLAVAFAEDGIAVAREHRLSPTDRVDFFDHGTGVAVEVKVASSTAEVIRQLWRYAKCDTVREIVLVSSRSAHASALPPAVNGKPVRVVHVGGFP